MATRATRCSVEGIGRPSGCLGEAASRHNGLEGWPSVSVRLGFRVSKGRLRFRVFWF